MISITVNQLIRYGNFSQKEKDKILIQIAHLQLVQDNLDKYRREIYKFTQSPKRWWEI